MARKPEITRPAPTTPAPMPGTRDDQMLEGYRKLAWGADEMFRVPGTKFRFGFDSIIGLVPGAGDLTVGALGAYALLLAFKLRAPVPVLTRMLMKITVDTIFGAVPLIGDLFDATWKANTKNRKLLDTWLANPRRAERQSRWVVVVFSLLFAAIVAGSLWLAWMVLSWMVGVIKS